MATHFADFPSPPPTPRREECSESEPEPYQQGYYTDTEEEVFSRHPLEKFEEKTSKFVKYLRVHKARCEARRKAQDKRKLAKLSDLEKTPEGGLETKVSVPPAKRQCLGGLRLGGPKGTYLSCKGAFASLGQYA
jgi:hypothetical protein